MQRLKIVFLSLILISCSKKEQLLPELDYPHAYVVTGKGRSLDLINLSTHSMINSMLLTESSDKFPHHVYASTSGRFLAISNPGYDFSLGHNGLHGKTFSGELLIYDSRKRQIVQTITTPFANHNAVFSPDEKQIWTSTASHSGRALAYSFPEGKLLAEITLDADPSDIIFSPDGKFLFVASGESTFLQVIDAEKKELVKKIKVDISPDNVWPGNNNMVLVSNSLIKSINFVDIKSFEVSDFIDLDFSPGFACLNPSDNDLWVCSPKTDEVFVFSKINNIWVQKSKVSVAGEPHMIHFYNSGKKALIISQSSSEISFYDIQTEEIKTISTSAAPNGIVIFD